MTTQLTERYKNDLQGVLSCYDRIVITGTLPGVCYARGIACSAYEPWHDKQTHKTYLRSTPGKCLHYYFYFMDAEVGFCYLRVPTWCPFRLQFYCNGHSWLANKLTA